MTQITELYSIIMQQLSQQPGLDPSQIAISIKDYGVVILGGKVKSYIEKYMAEEAVKKIENVKGIANELEVDLAASYHRTDAEIAQNAVNALRSSMFVPDESIKVTVEDRHLTLSGEVDHYFEKEYAEKAVRHLIGIKSVVNNIIVKSPLTSDQIKEKLIDEFVHNALIEAASIEVQVQGCAITLKGKVRNLEEEEEAKKIAWSMPGVTKVNSLLTINK